MFEVSEGTIERYVIPGAIAGTGGYVAYTVSEEHPEAVGLLTAVGATFLITR